MKITYTFLIPILFILINSNQEMIRDYDFNLKKIAEMKTILNFKNNNLVYQQRVIVADTITNWQFYKDSELLFRSNILDSNRLAGTVKTNDNYKFLIFKLFYDFNNQIMDRKIELIYNNKILIAFKDKNRSHVPFLLSKNEIDKIIKANIGKEIYINYIDSIHKKGIIIGILNFVN